MLEEENLHHFFQVDMKGEKCHLVTGDGGIEVKEDEYDVQGLCNAKLFFSEILYAFQILHIGGTFILKIYDTVHDTTVNLL
jgi:hypothetical protein